MFHRTSFVTAIALSVGLAFPAMAETHGGPKADTVIASVNGSEITLGHVIVAYLSLPDQYRALPPEQLFDGLINQLVQQELLAQAAGDPSLATSLQIENQTRSLKAGEQLNNLVDAGLTDDAIQETYESIYADADPTPEFNAAHILVEDRETGLVIIEDLKKGADFAEQARTHSTGPSGPNGGELDWFGPGMMVPEFEEAVKMLKPGEFSEDPVQTQFGWHVILLKEKRILDAPPLDQVRGDVMTALRNEIIEQSLEALETGAEVERMTDGFDPALITNSDLIMQ